MRKAKVLLATLAVPLVLGVASGMLQADTENAGSSGSDIAIDAAHFPDANFRSVVKEFDENKDGKLSAEERETVGDLNCSGQNVTSVKGVEYFPNLGCLNCAGNELTEVDISKNAYLTQLYCGYNHIKSLDFSGYKNLEVINCSGGISYIDEKGEEFEIEGELESINVSGCENLRDLIVDCNKLHELDLSTNAHLQFLFCDYNPLNSLDVSHNVELLGLSCMNDNLSKLDVSMLPLLQSLDCRENKLSKLDVTHNGCLSELVCSSNKITALDVTKCLPLVKLDCDNNQLTSLDLSQNQGLCVCSTEGNKIAKLEIGATQIADVYDEKKLEDRGTYYAFYTDWQSDIYYWLSFDKATKVSCKKQVKNVCKIDENTFPDVEFRFFVLEFDRNQDGYFSASELASVQSMNLNYMEIYSIKGIEYFTNLTSISCNDTKVTDFDLSKNVALREISIDEGMDHRGYIKTVDISGCVNVVTLDCFARGIQKLDLTKLDMISELYIDVSAEILDLSGNKNLKIVNIVDEKLTSLNLSDSKQLETVLLEAPVLKTLQLPDRSNLKGLFLYCESLTSVKVGNYPELEGIILKSNVIDTLDLSQNPKLESLNLITPQLTKLDISKQSLLVELCIDAKSITSLDLSQNPRLESFVCFDGNLQQLDFSPNTKLREIMLYTCTIGQMNVSACKNLEYLSMDHCKIPKLDVSHNLNLGSLWCPETTFDELPDFSKNVKLHGLCLYGSKVGTVDISFLPDLEEISLCSMDLTSLDLSKNPNLLYIDVSDNLLTELDLSYFNNLNYVDLRLNLFKEKPKYNCVGQDHFEPQKSLSGTFETFVERLYTIALNRSSDPEGKAFWVKQVVEEGKTGADCARFFLLDAPEFMNRNLNVDDFVETLYKTFFDRQSDAEGKKGWVEAINSGKKTRTDVVNDFIESTEWCDVCASYGVKSGAQYHKATRASDNAIRFATRLYTCCLGRDAEDGGLKYWSLALTNLEQTGAAAALQFFESEEFLGLDMSERAFVEKLYATFMDRVCTDDGVNYWSGELKAGRQTRHSVLVFFAQSEEFTKICKQYGIERGTI